jgi:hypothetical protein
MIIPTVAMVRARLRRLHAILSQRGDLPTAAEAQIFALRLELLRRIDEAEAAGDQARLDTLLGMAARW